MSTRPTDQIRFLEPRESREGCACRDVMRWRCCCLLPLLQLPHSPLCCCWLLLLLPIQLQSHQLIDLRRASIIIIDTSRVGPQAAALGNLPQTAPGKVGPQPFLSTAFAQPLSSPFRPLLLALPNLSSPGLHSPASVLVDHHVPCHHLPTQTRLPRRRRLLSRAMRCDRERRSCASWSDPD